MFTNLKRLWDGSKLTIEQLQNAVVKGWINPEQYLEITGEEYIA